MVRYFTCTPTCNSDTWQEHKFLCVCVCVCVSLKHWMNVKMLCQINLNCWVWLSRKLHDSEAKKTNIKICINFQWKIWFWPTLYIDFFSAPTLNNFLNFNKRLHASSMVWTLKIAWHTEPHSRNWKSSYISTQLEIIYLRCAVQFSGFNWYWVSETTDQYRFEVKNGFNMQLFERKKYHINLSAVKWNCSVFSVCHSMCSYSREYWRRQRYCHGDFTASPFSDVDCINGFLLCGQSSRKCQMLVNTSQSFAIDIHDFTRA